MISLLDLHNVNASQIPAPVIVPRPTWCWSPCRRGRPPWPRPPCVWPPPWWSSDWGHNNVITRLQTPRQPAPGPGASTYYSAILFLQPRAVQCVLTLNKYPRGTAPAGDMFTVNIYFLDTTWRLRRHGDMAHFLLLFTASLSAVLRS